jgi:hypothetical protein
MWAIHAVVQHATKHVRNKNASTKTKDCRMLKSKLTLGAVVILLAVSVGRAANIPVVAGFNAITIPFVPSLNYSANNIFSTALDGEAAYRWNAQTGSWLIYFYDSGLGGWYADGGGPAPIFNVGEGIFYFAVAPQTFVANFHGRNVRDPAAPVPGGQVLLQNRYYFQGSPTGMSASYEDIFGGPPNNETALFRFIRGRSDINPTGPDYRVYHYTDGVWSPDTPTMDPLEPVFVIHPYLRVKYTVGGNPGQIDLTWPRGELQEAPLPTGPWETVSTTGSHSVTPGAEPNRARFYRAKE